MADADAESVTGKRAVEVGAGGGAAGSEPEAKRNKADSEGAPSAAVDALANRPATKAKLEWLYQTGKVKKGEIAQSTLLQLSEVSDSRGVEIVEQFSESDLSDVPDKSSFFSGVIKCFRSPYSGGASAPAPAAVPTSSYQGAPGGGMWPSVEAKLESIYATGNLKKGELDSRCLDQLKTLSETSGLEVLNKFSEVDLATINSKGGFFMGIVKRFKEQERGVFAGLNPSQFPAAVSAGQNVFQGAPGGGFWPSVKAKLDSIYATGQLQPGDLDSRCLEQLKTLPEYLGLEVVTKFGEADLGSIKSKGGFFMGIIKRFKEQVVASDPTLSNQTFAGLPYLVQAKLEGLFSTGLVQRHDLDAKCFIELRQLPEIVALEVLDKFCETQLSTIRNKTAFFLGIIKRFRSERGIRPNAPGAVGVSTASLQQQLQRGGGGLGFGGQPFITYPGGASMSIGGYAGLSTSAGMGGMYGDPYQAQLLAAQAAQGLQLDQQLLLQQQQQQQAAQLAAAGYGHAGGGAEGLLGGNYQHGGYNPY